MSGIGLQIAAESDRTAVLELGWAVGADTFAVAAIDGDELARTGCVAGAAVIEIGLQIDAAGGRARREVGGARLRVVLPALNRQGA
jgi:hypothetical protein